MPNYGASDRDLLDRLGRLEAQVAELTRLPGQAISQVRDASDNVVFSANNDHLGRPYLPITFHDRLPYDRWVRCTSLTWQSLKRGHMVKQHPAFSAIVCGVSGPGIGGATDGSQNGGSGWVRLTANGVPLLPDMRINQNSSGFETPVGPFALPGDHMDQVVIELWGKSDWANAYIAVDVINGFSREFEAPAALAGSATQDDASI